MTHPTERELLPCPFCGSKNIELNSGYRVECRDCWASVGASISRLDNLDERMVTAWNTRATPQPAIFTDEAYNESTVCVAQTICQKIYREGMKEIDAQDLITQELYKFSHQQRPKHKWTGQQVGGHPADATSSEWVKFCKNCGVEINEDNVDGFCERRADSYAGGEMRSIDDWMDDWLHECPQDHNMFDWLKNFVERIQQDAIASAQSPASIAFGKTISTVGKQTVCHQTVCKTSAQSHAAIRDETFDETALRVKHKAEALWELCQQNKLDRNEIWSALFDVRREAQQAVKPEGKKGPHPEHA